MNPKLPARARIRNIAHDDAWERHVLPSGITVVTEHVPTVSSLAIGIFVKSGTRDEEDHLAGMAHFIEHLVFKGTRTRSTYEIARSLESVGGELDAFTGRDSTSFYARVLEEHLPLAVEVLADLACNPLLSPEEVDKEKKVIIEEIRSFDDNPEDLVFEHFSAELWQGHPLGRPILGTEKSIGAMRAGDIRDWHSRHYTADNLLVAAAGSFDLDELLAEVERHVRVPRGLPARRADALPPGRAGASRVVKDLSQEQMVLGLPSVSYTDPRRFAVNMLATAMGGGMSSRLFQAVRERESLAYSVFTFADFYSDAGVFCSALGCAPEETQRAIDVVLSEYELFRKEGLRAGELESAREQMKGGLLLGLESMGSRMSRLARSEMYMGRKVGVDELVGAIEDVTASDLHELAQEYLDPARSLLATLGPTERVRWNEEAC